MNKRKIDVIMMLIITYKSFLIFIAACSEMENLKKKVNENIYKKLWEITFAYINIFLKQEQQ